MTISLRTLLSALCLLLLCLGVCAANPPGVSLTLSVAGGRTLFHRGEIIPLSAVFASSKPGYQLNTDPGSRDLAWNSDTFQCDDASGATDPLRVYYSREFGMSYNGAGPGFDTLTAKPIAIAYTLNEWLRFDTPGRYRVSLTSGRIVDAAKQHEDLFSFSHSHTVVSNAVEFTVLPDDLAWDAAALRAALPLFNAASHEYQTQDAQTAATRIIRFLGTPEAGRALVARYKRFTEYDSWNSPVYFQVRLGVYGFPQRDFILREMKREIASPDFAVFQFFLSDLAETQFLDAYPQTIPAYVPNNPTLEKQRQALLRQRGDALTAFEEQDAQALAAALPVKTGRAKAISLCTLAEPSDIQADTPAHRKQLRALVPVFEALTPEEQSSLLDAQNLPTLRGPDMLPALRRLYAHPATTEGYDAVTQRSLILRRIVDLSPAEGRALLLAEVKRTDPRVDTPTLSMLPTQTLPSLNGTLAAHLESSLRLGADGDAATASYLVERYATAAILPRMKAIYATQEVRSNCEIQTNLIAYFLRVNPAYGAAQMRKVLASRKETGCYRFVLGDAAALHYGPSVEKLAILHLHDPDPQTAADAAKTLGTYGFAAAEAALWSRMREWHRQWAGKAGQIDPLEHSASEAWELEYALTQALANATGWLLNAAQLRTLDTLCITSGGHQNMAALVQDWALPIQIIYGGTEDQWSVVQYQSLSPLAALKSKLTQFPAGTRFVLAATNFPGQSEQTRAFRELQPFLTQHRMALTEEAFRPR